MKNAELKEAVAKYIESKELVLMGYSPEYIDDVKNDMEVAFRAGAEWMAGRGFISEGIINQISGEGTIIELNEHIGYLEDCEEVIVNIRKKQ